MKGKCGACAPGSKLPARVRDAQCRQAQNAGGRCGEHTAPGRVKFPTPRVPGCIPKAGTQSDRRGIKADSKQ